MTLIFAAITVSADFCHICNQFQKGISSSWNHFVPLLFLLPPPQFSNMVGTSKKPLEELSSAVPVLQPVGSILIDDHCNSGIVKNNYILSNTRVSF